ncbi:MAG: alpha/beta hydrolase [Pseudomonadota bacterium]|nr:alpha/beta hydrolase [Pseudomonadota bacterium]
MASWSDRYWTSRDGLKLHYRDHAGPDDRPPILCLHGLTRNSRDFEALAERLAGEWRVISPDFRGRGLSEYDPQSSRYMPPTYAADVLQLLDELQIDKAVFVGTSLGGLTTMIVAGFAPQRIAGVVLNDIGPELSSAGIGRISDYVGNPVLYRDWDEAADIFSAKFGDVHPRYGRDEWLRYARRVCRETDRGIEFDYDMTIAEPFKQMDEKTAAAADAWPLFHALAGKPVLLLRGERSDLLSPQVAEKMRDSMPGVELVTVPNVGHAPDFEEPESIEAVERLLGRVLEG